mmetsp:Transcript_31227/g.61820  ORF Transcript_31227/g.61820 Transcript_31227/m.61820 type:complete len:97 (-) Transcript_31227:415-705(-)
MCSKRTTTQIQREADKTLRFNFDHKRTILLNSVCMIDRAIWGRLRSHPSGGADERTGVMPAGAFLLVGTNRGVFWCCTGAAFQFLGHGRTDSTSRD